MLLWRLAPSEQRRIQLVWAMSLAGLAFWLTARAAGAPRWIGEALIAIEQVIGLHLAVVLLFRVLLKRLRPPRILMDLAVGAGYITIFVLL